MPKVPPTLLIVEDDDGVRTSMRLAMEDAGFRVLEHPTAEGALALVQDQAVDAMLVDLMLGAMDGFSFIRRVRSFNDAPIIVVSARTGTDDIVEAIEAGADDYVSKPYVVREVEVRLAALLRRPTLGLPPTHPTDRSGAGIVLDSREGPLRFQPGAGTLRRGATEVRLTSTEFRLLAVLAEHAGLVLSREILLQRVWDRGFFGDERIVDVHVRRLRQKIEVLPGKPEILVTVRGLGYRLDPR